MCIRVNNVQLLVQVWPMLEKHIHMITDIAHENCSSDQTPEAVRKDVGFFSKESLNVIQHLKKIQLALVHLVCLKVRMASRLAPAYFYMSQCSCFEKT